jgi:hypothetical protein
MSTLNNCIAFYSGPDGSLENSVNLSMVNNSCITPLPQWSTGNITQDPQFLDFDAGNLRLQSNSPCINAGDYASVSGSTDLDGRPRIVGSTVDMGAYEFQGPGLSEFISWLQQYSLPTDGSADSADSDLDGHNNWQEWKAWTIPTNALSLLQLLTPQPQPDGLLLTWQSALGHNYSLERATNATGPFSLLHSNIIGQADTTSVADTNLAGGRAFLYRVSVPE